MEHLDRSVALQLLAGELPAEERTECERHVAACAPCRDLVGVLAREAQREPGSGEATATGTALAAQDDPGPMRLPRGATIGRFLVLDKLGQGGMGEVYAAFDPQLSRKVAIKLLLPRSLADEGDDGALARERLLREAQAMAQLSHPNVVPVFDVGEHAGCVFIAMELVEGSTLRAWMRTERRPWRDVVRLFVDAGRGLAAAHAAGLVHRDFKPDNVLLSKSGRVYVMDFGLARAGGEPSDAFAGPASSGGAQDPSLSQPLSMATLPSGLLNARLTLQQGTIGTPGYMPPEQIRNEELDARADVFAFCVTLYTALYGHKPFTGATVREVLTATLVGHVPPPPRGTRVPGWLHKVLLEGLAGDRDRRFASMDALLAALQDDPAVRTRRWAGAAAAVALLAAGVAVPRASTARKTAACEAEGRAFAQQAWGPERRAAVRAAFEATRVPYAGAVLRSVTGALDAYAGNWAAQRTQACVATRVEGEASQSELALRTACLDGRLREAAALTEVLSSADAKTVEKAVTAVTRLSPLATCANMDALVRQVRPPASPELAARVTQHREALARSKALGNAGRYKEAVDDTQATLAQVRTLGYAPLVAEALVELGQAQQGFGTGDVAEESFYAALVAAEGSNHDEVKLRAMMGLVWPSADNAARAREGRRWLSLARALAARLPGTESTLAHLEYFEGWLLLRENLPEQGLPLMRRALDAVTAREGPESTDAFRIGNGLAGMLMMVGRTSEAAAEYERLLARQVPVLGAEHPGNGITHANLSLIHMLRGDFARSLEATRAAQRIFQVGLSARHPHLLRMDVNAGLALLGLGRNDEAHAVLQRALTELEAVKGKDNPQLNEPLTALAAALVELGRPAEALPHARRALALVQALPDDGKSARTVGGMVGGVYLELGRAAQALPLLRGALKQAEADPAMLAPADLPYLRFLTARAQWECGEDRPGALAQAQQALAQLQGPGTDIPAAKVRAWLARHARG